MTCSGFSLREKLLKDGISEKDISGHLKTAYDLITTIPGLSVRRFNARRPMEGISSG